MHKKENFYIKLLTNVGNPDFKQDPTQRVWGTNEIKNVGYKKLSLLRELVTAYRDQNDLGGQSRRAFAYSSRS